MSGLRLSAAVISMSASTAAYICRTRVSKPLNTDSRTIIAATGTATASRLTPAMMFITECDLREIR